MQSSARSILDSVYVTVERIHADIESEKISILAGRKRELRNLVLLTESHIQNVRALVARGQVIEDEAKRGILEELRSFKYGNNDYITGYIYIFDSTGTMLIHPNPDMESANFSSIMKNAGFGWFAQASNRQAGG